MPLALPDLHDADYTLPEAAGRLFDFIILPIYALRPLADSWWKMATVNLLRAGPVVRPLRAAADAAQRTSPSISAADDAETTSAVSDLRFFLSEPSSESLPS